MIFTPNKLKISKKNNVQKKLSSYLQRLGLGVTFSKQIASEATQYESIPEMQNHVIKEIMNIFPENSDIEIDENTVPYIISLVGINGSGKTTSIMKMANLLKLSGWSLMVVSCDNIRTAAEDQIESMLKNFGCPYLIAGQHQSLKEIITDAKKICIAKKIQIMLIDTPGFVFNNIKVASLLKNMFLDMKNIHCSSNKTIAVVDANAGQNIINQFSFIKKFIKIDGLFISKVDMNSNLGSIVSLCKKFHLPIHGLGNGENVANIEPFERESFSRTFFNLHYFLLP